VHVLKLNFPGIMVCDRFDKQGIPLRNTYKLQKSIMLMGFIVLLSCGIISFCNKTGNKLTTKTVGGGESIFGLFVMDIFCPQRYGSTPYGSTEPCT